MAIRMAGLKELEEMVENTLHDREIRLLKDLTRARKRRKSGCLSLSQRKRFHSQFNFLGSSWREIFSRTCQ
jgi:hypothetical protein